jgi:signal transduction histidine kinase
VPAGWCGRPAPVEPNGPNGPDELEATVAGTLRPERPADAPTVPSTEPEPGPPARPDRAPRWSLRRWVAVVSTLSVLVMLAAIVAGTVALRQLGSARAALVDQLDPALLGAQKLSVALVDEETGVRGYAITGVPAFLEPYQSGRQQEVATTADLRQLVADPELGSSLDGVLAAAQRWRVEYAEPTITAVGAGGSRAGAPDAGIGKSLFDVVRAELEAQRVELVRARGVARDALDAAANRLVLTGIGIALGLLVLLVALFVWARLVVTVPISRLAATVRAVAAGRFGQTVDVTTGPREIIELAEDVDSMRTRIVAELDTTQSLNARLVRQTRDLEYSNRDLEQFAYVASHDLQEPLRKVSGFCELLRTRYGDDLDERANTYIDFAVDGARRMSVLINDLLAFSRVGRGSVTAAPQDCEVLLAAALGNLEKVITETGAQVTHDTLPTLPGVGSLLTTLFQNLVGNGLKFRTGEPPRIHVGVERDGEFWSFRVSDNGIGIDPAYAERIFIIFQRLHAKADYPGTGIGLALCRKIVEHHGGRIWLDPATTSGATFRFTVPIAEPGAEPIADRFSSVPVSGGTGAKLPLESGSDLA